MGNCCAVSISIWCVELRCLKNIESCLPFSFLLSFFSLTFFSFPFRWKCKRDDEVRKEIFFVCLLLPVYCFVSVKQEEEEEDEAFDCRRACRQIRKENFTYHCMLLKLNFSFFLEMLNFKFYQYSPPTISTSSSAHGWLSLLRMQISSLCLMFRWHKYKNFMAYFSLSHKKRIHRRNGRYFSEFHICTV